MTVNAESPCPGGSGGIRTDVDRPQPRREASPEKMKNARGIKQSVVTSTSGALRIANATRVRARAVESGDDRSITRTATKDKTQSRADKTQRRPGRQKYRMQVST